MGGSRGTRSKAYGCMLCWPPIRWKCLTIYCPRAGAGCKEPRDEPFTFCEKSRFPIAKDCPALIQGNFTQSTFGGRLLGGRPGLSLALKHHRMSHTERVACEVAAPPLHALAGDTLCSQECTDGWSVIFARAHASGRCLIGKPGECPSIMPV